MQLSIIEVARQPKATVAAADKQPLEFPQPRGGATFFQAVPPSRTFSAPQRRASATPSFVAARQARHCVRAPAVLRSHENQRRAWASAHRR